MNKKILLIANSDNYNKKAVETSYLDIGYSYKDSNNIFFRIGRKLWQVLNLPYYSCWFDFNSKEIEKYDCVLIFECRYPNRLIEYIRKRNTKCRIIYWLWNAVGTSINPIFYSSEKNFFNLLKKKDLYNIEIWSFDKGDCERYNLNYNNQVSYKLNFDEDKENIKYDIFFCGIDKYISKNLTRLSFLKKIEKKFTNYKIKILILPNKFISYKKEDKKYFLERSLDYEEIINYVNKSKCIIDLCQIGQRGLTWRPLEAMFYRKKLITNFKDITEYDFYKKDNIFLLKENNLDLLYEFMKRPYKNIEKNIIYKYTSQGWWENFNK